jgi:lipopolysaccharide export LptBFGC system permease protein LptF
LILVVYYQALNFGDAMAKRDLLAPPFGLWLPFALFLIGTGYLLLRALRGGRPVTIFGRRPQPSARATT